MKRENGRSAGTKTSKEFDVDRAQAACGLLDVEAHDLSLVKKLDVRRQFGAMHEHVAAAVIADKEAKTLALVEEFYFARHAHLCTFSAMWSNAHPLAGPRSTQAQRRARLRNVCLEAAGAVLQGPHAREEMEQKSGAVKAEDAGIPAIVRASY